MTDDERVPWKPIDAIIVFLLAWIGLPVLVAVVLASTASTVPLAHQLLTKLSNGDISVNFLLVAADAVVAFWLVGYYLRRYRARWRDLGLRKFSPTKALVYFLITFFGLAVLVFMAYAVVKLLFPAFNPNQEQANEFTKATSPGMVKLSFLALVVIPPLLEEIVFRGFMFPAFSKRLGVVGGAVVSSLLFGAAHMQSNIIVYTVILGLLLCLLYRRLDSIWPGVALHMFNNYLAFMALVHK